MQHNVVEQGAGGVCYIYILCIYIDILYTCIYIYCIHIIHTYIYILYTYIFIYKHILLMDLCRCDT